MRSRVVHRVTYAVASLAMAVLLAMPLPRAIVAVAAQVAPHVTVFVKNYQAEYSVATSEFLADQFDDLDSPAYGLVRYTVVTSLTPASLEGSAALVIDESADMSLSSAEGDVIRAFVGQGGKVGLFTFPRFYWNQVAPNPAAFQVIADLFGSATVGEPASSEMASGISSAEITEYGCVQGVCFTQPYSVTGMMVTTNDDAPFTPISSTGTSAVLTSAALGGAPVAVANGNGLLVTGSIGDMIQGSDANEVYEQFVTDAIVWLANAGSVLPNHTYLPNVFRQ